MIPGNLLRPLIAVVLFIALAACGNKGALVKASRAMPADETSAPADNSASPTPSDPTEADQPDVVPLPPATDPAPTTPPADGGGNG